MSGKPDAAHHFIHHESRTGQVTRFFKNQYEEKKNENLRQKYNDTADAGNDSINDKTAEDAVGQHCCKEFSGCSDTVFDPLHGNFRPAENSLEHEKQYDNQNRKTENRVQYKSINFLVKCISIRMLLYDIVQNPSGFQSGRFFFASVSV